MNIKSFKWQQDIINEISKYSNENLFNFIADYNLDDYSSIYANWEKNYAIKEYRRRMNYSERNIVASEERC